MRAYYTLPSLYIICIRLYVFVSRLYTKHRSCILSVAAESSFAFPRWCDDANVSAPILNKSEIL